MAGIICKVWNIQGNTAFKGTSAQLKDSIGYILNDEKTEQGIQMEGSIINNLEAQLSRECQYVENDIKTMNGALIGTHNVLSSDIKGAVEEMMEVKQFYNKFDGRAALHGIISLPESESNIKNASSLLMLCQDVMKVFPNNQAVFAVHTNTDNLHVHFIINSVGLDGKKIHQDKNFMKKVLQPCINKYAEKYGFSINDEWKKKIEKEKVSYADLKIGMRKIIDQTIEHSSDFNDFVDRLRDAGMTVNIGKYLSLKTPDMTKAIRTHQLGGNYTKDAIVDRIATRMDVLKSGEIDDLIYSGTKDEIYNVQMKKMRKYKDLSAEEKKFVVRQLKMGNNPFKMQREMNWQLNEIANRLNLAAHIMEIKDFYSNDGSLQGALDGIIERKKQIAEEKKQIKSRLNRYKPIIDIYEEMKPIQKKSYLYEHEGVKEYRTEFEQFRRLTRRLREGYGKDIMEVQGFIEECDRKIQYANSQLAILSEEYREIKRYAIRHGNIEIKGNLESSLENLLEIHESVAEAKRNSFSGDMFYIVSKKSDVMLRVVKYPSVDKNGKPVEVFETSIINSSGKVLDKTDNINGSYDFLGKIKYLERKYGLTSCTKYKDMMLAKEFIKANKADIDSENIENGIRTESTEHTPEADSGVFKEKKKYSFTQAINLNSAKGKEGVYTVANSRASDYIIMLGN